MVALADKLGDGYQVMVVGVTPEQKGQLPSNVVGITRTNSVEELREIYAIADVFVNPTYEDNYPTTNLEARTCGTPVITYRTGGSAESADLIVDQNDVSRVANILQHQIKVTSQFDAELCSRESMTRKYMFFFQLR